MIEAKDQAENLKKIQEEKKDENIFFNVKHSSNPFVKNFKTVNVNIQKKLSKFLTNLLAIKVNISVKEVGIKSKVDSEDYFIFVKANNVESLLVCDKKLTSVISSKFIDGSFVEKQDLNLTKIEKKIFIDLFVSKFFEFYLKELLNISFEKIDFSFTDKIDNIFYEDELESIYVCFDINSDLINGNLTVLLPLKYFDSEIKNIDIKKILTQNIVDVKKNIDYSKIPVELKVVWGNTFITTKDIKNLSVDSLIKFDKENPDDVFVLSENNFIIKGLIGKTNNKLGIKITKILK